MKFRNSLAILAFSAAFLLAACGNNGGEATSSASKSSSATTSQTTSETSKITVTFDSRGGSPVASQTIDKGGKATKPADPSKEGFTFGTWNVDEACTMPFDFNEALLTNTTLYASWVEDSQATSESTPVEEGYLYFCDAEWWNAMGGETAAKFDNDDSAFGEVMEYVYYDTVEKCRYAKIEIPEEATTVTFYRVYLDQTEGVYKFGNSKTIEVDLDLENYNMYDISDATASWGEEAAVEGVWTNYDPSDVPSSEDSSESGESSSTAGGDYYGPEGSELVSWYIAGEGKHFSGWSLQGGIQLFSNPDSATDKGCILNVEFDVGDLFKVTDGTTWYGYEMCDPYDDPSNAGLYCFEGAPDGYGKNNWKCTVAGFYDMYVNKDGNFWVQAHAA